MLQFNDMLELNIGLLGFPILVTFVIFLGCGKGSYGREIFTDLL